MKKNTALLFPGQGAQYIGMGHDFVEQFGAARQTIEEAEDILGNKISSLIFNGKEEVLALTKHSQPAIFVISMAIFRVFEELFGITPCAASGLSLGEYCALVAAKKCSFAEALRLVEARGEAIHEACDKNPGIMVAILGLDDAKVEAICQSLDSPLELFVANYNCPGQIVISGTKHAVEEAATALCAAGARAALPLRVHGAFHSGLMNGAREKLSPLLLQAHIVTSDIPFIANVTGEEAGEAEVIKKLLVEQITAPVRWHQGIRTIDNRDAKLFLEIGPGKTLAGLNKRIGVRAKTLSLGKVEDLKLVELALR
jgi:[acyl-carrier-protein] S-malonyltransferase